MSPLSSAEAECVDDRVAELSTSAAAFCLASSSPVSLNVVRCNNIDMLVQLRVKTGNSLTAEVLCICSWKFGDKNIRLFHREYHIDGSHAINKVGGANQCSCMHIEKMDSFQFDSQDPNFGVHELTVF